MCMLLFPAPTDLKTLIYGILIQVLYGRCCLVHGDLLMPHKTNENIHQKK